MILAETKDGGFLKPLVLTGSDDLNGEYSHAVGIWLSHFCYTIYIVYVKLYNSMSIKLALKLFITISS